MPGDSPQGWYPRHSTPEVVGEDEEPIDDVDGDEVAAAWALTPVVEKHPIAGPGQKPDLKKRFFSFWMCIYFCFPRCRRNIRIKVLGVVLMKVRIIAPDSSSLSPEVGTCFTKGSRRLDWGSLSVQNYISLAAKLNCNETFDTSAPMRRKLYISSEESGELYKSIHKGWVSTKFCDIWIKVWKSASQVISWIIFSSKDRWASVAASESDDEKRTLVFQKEFTVSSQNITTQRDSASICNFVTMSGVRGAGDGALS